MINLYDSSTKERQQDYINTIKYLLITLPRKDLSTTGCLTGVTDGITSSYARISEKTHWPCMRRQETVEDFCYQVRHSSSPRHNLAYTMLVTLRPCKDPQGVADYFEQLWERLMPSVHQERDLALDIRKLLHSLRSKCRYPDLCDQHVNLIDDFPLEHDTTTEVQSPQAACNSPILFVLDFHMHEQKDEKRFGLATFTNHQKPDFKWTRKALPVSCRASDVKKAVDCETGREIQEEFYHVSRDDLRITLQSLSEPGLDLPLILKVNSTAFSNSSNMLSPDSPYHTLAAPTLLPFSRFSVWMK